ncbi:carboxypeptidase regulatory-like domain-containing protein [bacterium]|nr:carboxypeptidase regulatory-like domain-containing protein [bacterium]
MKRKISRVFTIFVSIGFVASQAMAATVCGVAQNPQGSPLAGATVTVKDPSGKVLGSAVTDGKGNYSIDNVSNGTVDLFLDTGSTALKNGSGVLNLSGATQAVNWEVSSNANAIATQGGSCVDPPGPLTPAEWASIGVLGLGVAAGGAAIGWAESGNRSDHHPHPPMTSQQ